MQCSVVSYSVKYSVVLGRVKKGREEKDTVGLGKVLFGIEVWCNHAV